MSMTTTETFGFCAAVSQLLKNNKAALTPKGLNADVLTTALDGKTAAAMEKNNAQEAAKAQLRTLTTDANAAKRDAYNTASSALDAYISAVGKTSDAGRQAARLRSDIRRAANPPASPAAKP